MSAEKRQWTDEQRISAAGKIYDMCSGDWGEMSMDRAIDLQCEHTALYEALAGLIRARDSVTMRQEGELLDEFIPKARAALSAAQKEGTR